MPRAHVKREPRLLNPPPNGHESRNGAIAVAGDVLPQTALPMQRKERWLPLHPTEYPGWEIKVWLNYPRRLRDAAFYSGTDPQQKEERLAALRRIVLAHNGWADDEGVPFPPADTEAFWEDIPDEVGSAIFLRLFVETNASVVAMYKNWDSSANGS